MTVKRPPTIDLDPASITSAETHRFYAKVAATDDCHLWTAAINSAGYGVFRQGGRQVYAHRLAWVLEHASRIPDGMRIDHLCRTTRCVRPSHLELVTPGENTDRQPNAPRKRTHCPAGHPYAGTNLYRFPDGRRACRTCQRDAQARYATRKKTNA